MVPRTLLTMAAVALTLLVSQPAHAQTTYDFKVPFDFIANGQTLKAGDYALVPNAADSVFTLQARAGTGSAVFLPVETRLAADSSVTQPTVVLDKIEGKLIMAELHVPGADGYLFNVTKARHTHEKVAGTPRKG